jgi:hypothetical protein
MFALISNFYWIEVSYFYTVKSVCILFRDSFHCFNVLDVIDHPEIRQVITFFCFCCWWDWGLNSGLNSCKASTLLLKGPYIFLFFLMSLSDWVFSAVVVNHLSL